MEFWNRVNSQLNSPTQTIITLYITTCKIPSLDSMELYSRFAVVCVSVFSDTASTHKRTLLLYNSLWFVRAIMLDLEVAHFMRVER